MNFLPLFLGLAHGVADAAAGYLVTQVLLGSVSNAGLLVLLYNGLAFGCQPLAGFALDRLNQPRNGAALGLLLAAAGLAVSGLHPALGLVLAGVGSALLHTGAGSLSITATPGQASGPGIFAAFGVVGLALGSQAEHSSLALSILVALLVALALVLWRVRIRPVQVSAPAWPNLTDLLPLLALLVAGALRSYVWNESDARLSAQGLALWVALAAGAGKLLGGLASDRLGWRRFALLTLIFSLALLLFASQSEPAGLAGIFFLQALTGLSLAASGRLLPTTPAFAASLTLGVGVTLGALPVMLAPSGLFSAWTLVIALFLAGGFYAWSLKR